MLVQHSIHDICGVGYDVQNRNFIATTGTGGVYHFDTAGHMLAAHITESLSEIRWDNHLLTLG
jgi:hypothetical protein